LHAIQRLNLPNEVEQTQGLFMQIANPSAREADGTGEDDEEESVTLTVVPPPVLQSESSALSLSSAGAEPGTIAASDMVTEATDQILATTNDNKSETPAQMLFAALSACSNLHPDLIQHDEDDDSEDGEQYSSYSAIDQGTSGGSLLQTGLAIRGSSDGGLPPPIEGSSGWITADNLHEYFDEEGNWIGEGEAPSFGVPSLGPGAGFMHPRDGNDHAQNGGEPADYGNDAAHEGEEAKWRRTH
jgi:nucleotide-sensitive chloride channel 1A